MKNPNALIVASEVYLSGIGSLLNNIARNSLTNIKIFDEDVRELLVTLPNKIFDEIYIICPDPWPKARHHKRRLIKQDFLKILVKVLKRDGTVYISTDWENYAESINEVLKKSKIFVNKSLVSNTVSTPTKFQKKAITEGRKIFSFKVKKK